MLLGNQTQYLNPLMKKIMVGSRQQSLFKLSHRSSSLPVSIHHLFGLGIFIASYPPENKIEEVAKDDVHIYGDNNQVQLGKGGNVQQQQQQQIINGAGGGAGNGNGNGNGWGKGGNPKKYST